jgi:hypothetical protein
MKTFLKLFFIFDIIGVIAIVVIIGLSGLFPPLAKIFNTDKPRDLAITFTPQDYNLAASDWILSMPLPATNTIQESVKYEGLKNTDFSINSSQLTSVVQHNKWTFEPVSSVQIKINPDGTAEASGILHIDRVLPFISLTHSTKQVEEAIAKYHIGGNPPFYIKGNVSITNNEVTLSPLKVEIGRISIPDNLVKDNTENASTFIEARLSAVKGLYIKSLNLDNGKLNFKGTIPEKEYTAQ